MRSLNRWVILAAIIVIAVLLVYERSDTSDSPAKAQETKKEKVLGNEITPVTLTEKEASRLGIETAPVREQLMAPSGSVQKVVPYASVLYGLNGETWLYTNPAPLTFARESITIDYIEADWAVLSKGPPVGSEVVTVGVSQLYGVDTGVGK